MAFDFQAGRVIASSRVSQCIACTAVSPHISCDGCRPPQKAGRSGRPKRRQRSSESSWTQGTPAGLPAGMPGIGLVMDGAMQQAPQFGRHVNVIADAGRMSGMEGLSAQVADLCRAA